LVGLLALLAGAGALVVGAGWLGEYRAQRAVLDPMAADWLGAHATPSRIGAIVAGVVLLVLGLWWFGRSVRQEGRPDLALEREPGDELIVTAAAISGAVRADAELIDGVSRARARSVGTGEHPALRLELWLREGADLKKVWAELDTFVLARARDSLGVEVLPTAVRVELDTGTKQRVR
ncbi:alkaline shock response membrane anchor protein AmaP, partial [Amycolatopsis sp. H20-H5]|uniref:alkaline shock response membrane anchor protein AmaP n=1 Tax=Amycolatopsis sp. H20-H5 TaxID=3046309 RepID=UPI002DBDACCD